MTWELITNRPLENGLGVVFIYINDITGGLFCNLLLVSVWLIATFGLYFASKGFEGKGDISLCLAVGGFIAAVSSILLSLVPGLINNWTLGVWVVVAVLSIAFFLSTKND